MSLLQLNPLDNVAIARTAIAAGAPLIHPTDDAPLTANADIPTGHKIALRPIATGERVLKYGQLIGIATQDIAAGDHVHMHNVTVPAPSPSDARTSTTPCAPHLVSEMWASTEVGAAPANFLGYQRPSGKAGTRNYIGILTTVNCSATVARRIAAHFTPERLADFPNIDGVVALTHSGGCGMTSSGEAADVLRRTTAGYAAHPNFAAVLVLGLGCEANQVNGVVQLAEQATANPATIRPFTIQEEGGTVAAIRRGIAEVESLLLAANATTRTPQPVSQLLIGLQCGGSDAWSGITANPALGLAVDRLVANGGSAILSETTEIFGAEHLLTARATPELARALEARIAWWHAYAARHNNVLDNNPSPGNKVGGLTTILEKSLGAVAKAGSTPLREVVEYAQPITQHGLIFMDSPGYDPVSATGQIASGANLICFTTGRGSVYGAKPVPSLKLSTTTGLYCRMSDDMDINCGTILDGTETLPEVADRIYATILATASGQLTRSEEHGFGEEEFQPWMLGAVL